MYQGKRHSKKNDSAHHSDIPAQREWWNTSAEKISTMFDSIYVDPFDIGDPCERTPELCYWYASHPQSQEKFIGMF